MTHKYFISVNQLADFLVGSEAKKKRIINQQKVPNLFLVPWYQLSRARIKKYLSNRGDVKILKDAISILKQRTPKNKRQITDRDVSIESLQRFIKLELPTYLKQYEYEVIKPGKYKSTNVEGVEIIVSPDLILKFNIDGQEVLGAIKVHISKGNIFKNEQCRYVSTLIYKYLNESIRKEGQVVSPELCICIDVFGERLIPVPRDVEKTMRGIEELCRELKRLWNVA